MDIFMNIIMATLLSWCLFELYTSQEILDEVNSVVEFLSTRHNLTYIFRNCSQSGGAMPVQSTLKVNPIWVHSL